MLILENVGLENFKGLPYDSFPERGPILPP